VTNAEINFTLPHLISKKAQPARHTGMDAGIQSQGCGCRSLFELQNTWHKPSMALDSGFPRQSLTGAGSAGMTTFVVLAEVFC
jgi:hypothetical protein